MAVGVGVDSGVARLCAVDTTGVVSWGVIEGGGDGVQLIETVETWRKTLDGERSAGRTVGLVPTMGYLHDGHVSLIRRAVAECDAVGVTLFVNPLQFAANEDLASYPRDLNADQALVTECGADYLFAPSLNEMYPAPVLTAVSVSDITARWEGAARPGHFAGVATVVTKLFAQAGPCVAYFGEKDFQQLAVIRQLVNDLSLPVSVVGCPTVREPDGLARSSRNVHLSTSERAAASALHRALGAGADEARRSGASPATVDGVMAHLIAAEPGFTLDYAAVVDSATLAPAARLAGELRLLVAARLGRVRLIDNQGVTV
jgi:pantoate--beta-alanine ligase